MGRDIPEDTSEIIFSKASISAMGNRHYNCVVAPKVLRNAMLFNFPCPKLEYLVAYNAGIAVKSS